MIVLGLVCADNDKWEENMLTVMEDAAKAKGLDVVIVSYHRLYLDMFSEQMGIPMSNLLDMPEDTMLYKDASPGWARLSKKVDKGTYKSIFDSFCRYANTKVRVLIVMDTLLKELAKEATRCVIIPDLVNKREFMNIKDYTSRTWFLTSIHKDITVLVKGRAISKLAAIYSKRTFIYETKYTTLRSSLSASVSSWLDGAIEQDRILVIKKEERKIRKEQRIEKYLAGEPQRKERAIKRFNKSIVMFQPEVPKPIIKVKYDRRVCLGGLKRNICKHYNGHGGCLDYRVFEATTKLPNPPRFKKDYSCYEEMTLQEVTAGMKRCSSSVEMSLTI